MQNITTIGLDVAKHVFQVHGMDHEGRAVLRKKVRRGQVAMANKTARTVWAMMRDQQDFNAVFR